MKEEVAALHGQLRLMAFEKGDLSETVTRLEKKVERGGQELLARGEQLRISYEAQV